MYYSYVLSTGEYSDYSDTTIYHKKRFTTKEFVEMYNNAVKNSTVRGFFQFEEVAEIMCEMFDFVQFEIVSGVHSGYKDHQEVPLEQVYNSSQFIMLSEIK